MVKKDRKHDPMAIKDREYDRRWLKRTGNMTLRLKGAEKKAIDG